MTTRIETASASNATTPVFVFDAGTIQTPNAFIITEPALETDEASETYRPRLLESRRRRAKRRAGRH